MSNTYTLILETISELTGIENMVKSNNLILEDRLNMILRSLMELKEKLCYKLEEVEGLEGEQEGIDAQNKMYDYMIEEFETSVPDC